ncbi:tetratricopeptide repeat protein [Falsiroseomonas sp. HW251]|uniref:tetratricopeptide repeat protein n=1 Tax=Falsiroseomonas sp. HW251 TaxID=3390998 RepID=UPI003D31CEFC
MPHDRLIRRPPALRAAAALAATLLPVGLAALLAVPPAAREARREGFVGSATCAGCHAAEHAAWSASDHARAMQPATSATVLGAFDGATAEGGGESATFRREGERFVILTDGPDGRPADLEVSETFGLDPLQQYLVRMPDGRRQVLPWAWDSRPREAGGQRWYHLMPDERLRAGDPLHWTGRDQNWNFMCASCHSTGLVRGFDRATGRYDTTWSEIAVGCESCHGPGAAHLAWAQAGAPADRPNGIAALRNREGGWRFAEGDTRGIARWEGPPRRAAAQLDACASCHSRARPLVADPLPGSRFLDTHAPVLLDAGLYHADGQIQGEVFEWGSFVQSRMARAGVVCGDCHEPHGGRLRAEGNAVCAQCHLPARFDTAAHHRHEAGSPGAQCASCHMPQATYMGVDRRHDHAFRVPRPDIAAATGAPDACTSCHADRRPDWAAARIADWFGPARREDPHPALAIAAGRRGERGADAGLAAIVTDRDQPAILRATAVSLLPMPPSQVTAGAIGAALLDAEPLVRAAALRALDGLDPRNRLHAARFLADDTRLVRIEAARALAPVPLAGIPEAQRPAFARAWQELIESEGVAAERPEAHVNIAGLLAARGDAAGAEAAYAEALARDPAWLPALVNLGDFQARSGRATEAVATLARAVALHPDAADAQFGLALALVRAGRTPEALAPLARAASLRPEEPRYGYVRAIALNDLGRRPEAIAALREVLARTPAHRDSLLALATLERDRGNLAEAERAAQALLAADPADRQAQALIAQLRAMRPRPPAAR